MLRSSLKHLQPALLLLAILAVFSSLPVLGEAPCPSLEALQGIWTEHAGETELRFEPERIVVREKGLLRAATVLRHEPCTLMVRDQGVRATWTLAGDSHAPKLDRGKGAVLLDRSTKVPGDLDVSPLPLPPAGPVPPEKAKEIAMELQAREDRDQEAYRSKNPERTSILADNIRYLREVVTTYGWIDISRFGKSAAAAAILIVKHSSDLRLVQDALSVAERDAKENGGGKELVSILVDDCLISLGQKQKYGTQITEDEHGRPYVIPVEDLRKVEEYRKELGILSWKEYLAKASEALYGGAPIRIPGPDE